MKYFIIERSKFYEPNIINWYNKIDTKTIYKKEESKLPAALFGLPSPNQDSNLQTNSSITIPNAIVVIAASNFLIKLPSYRTKIAISKRKNRESVVKYILSKLKCTIQFINQTIP